MFVSIVFVLANLVTAEIASGQNASVEIATPPIASTQNASVDRPHVVMCFADDLGRDYKYPRSIVVLMHKEKPKVETLSTSPAIEIAAGRRRIVRRTARYWRFGRSSWYGR
jgi:hypothetical protein